MARIKVELSENEKEFLINIGLRVGYFRKMKKMSQQDLADKSKLSLNSISHIECVAVIGISLITLHRLATALDIEVKQLLEFN